MLTHSSDRLPSEVAPGTIHEPMFEIELLPSSKCLNFTHIIITSKYAYQAIKNHIDPNTTIWSMSKPDKTDHNKWHTLESTISKNQHNAEKLLDLFIKQNPLPKNTGSILFARGGEVRKDLSHDLKLLNYTAESLVIYMQKPTKEFSKPTLKLLQAGKIRTVSFWSITALKIFEKLCLKNDILLCHLSAECKSKTIANSSVDSWKRQF